MAGLYYFSGLDDLNKQVVQWARDKTGGEIDNYSINPKPNTLVVLLNALYFNGKWSSPFSREKSAPEKFTTYEGEVKKLTMMKRGGSMSGVERNGFKGVSLDYGNGAFCMKIYLPDTKDGMEPMLNFFSQYGFPRFEHYEEVDLWLLRFETTSQMKLNNSLASLGVEKVFDKETAELPGILDRDNRLWIDEIAQTSVIRVDEEGTVVKSVSHGSTSGMRGGAGPSKDDFPC